MPLPVCEFEILTYESIISEDRFEIRIRELPVGVNETTGKKVTKNRHTKGWFHACGSDLAPN